MAIYNANRYVKLDDKKKTKLQFARTYTIPNI